MIYTVEDNVTTYAIKGTKKAAIIYANWLISKGHAVYIAKMKLIRKSDVEPSSDKPKGLFDDSYRVERIYRDYENWR